MEPCLLDVPLMGVHLQPQGYASCPDVCWSEDVYQEKNSDGAACCHFYSLSTSAHRQYFAPHREFVLFFSVMDEAGSSLFVANLNKALNTSYVGTGLPEVQLLCPVLPLQCCMGGHHLNFGSPEYPGRDLPRDCPRHHSAAPSCSFDATVSQTAARLAHADAHVLTPHLLPGTRAQIHSSNPGQSGNNSYGGDLLGLDGIPESLTEYVTAQNLTALFELLADAEFEVRQQGV